MSINEQIKDLMNTYPVLSGIFITVWFWLLSYHLGSATGEIAAAILNHL
jgi:hypothetical protein